MPQDTTGPVPIGRSFAEMEEQREAVLREELPEESPGEPGGPSTVDQLEKLQEIQRISQDCHNRATVIQVYRNCMDMKIPMVKTDS